MSTVRPYRKYLILFNFLFSVLFSVRALAQTPDHAREKRWADEITPAILVGDPVYLTQKSGHKFLALHAPNRQARAGVIVVHGMGVHPDWNLINVLRSLLAEQGYTTLSVQMPVLAADAKGEQYPALFADAAERLQAAVNFLRDKGNRKIAIVSHSMGARMANHFLAGNAANDIDAWVAVGISTGIYAQAENLKAPVLDIYGEKDFPAVLANAAKRADSIRRIRGSGQVSVAGADHYFNGAETELTRHIKRFLDNATR
jgi:dienelactone hydrolase